MTRSQSTTRIVLQQGDTVRHTFQLREYGKKTLPDVSGASAITLHWEDEFGVNQTPVVLSAVTPGADWGTGVLVVEFSPANLTADQGTFTFALRGVIDGETRTWETGEIETRETPGL